jgi:uncharacterized Fe-S cluster protein YjdI
MKEYSNGEITVIWDQDKCIHAKECVKGLPQVFSREKTPWINIKGASSEEIISVVNRCPSGALTYKKIGLAASAKKPCAEIKVTKNGPIIIEGGCILIGWDGKKVDNHGPVALCRCGGSKKKPFCDGTHIMIGFDDTK